MSGIGMGIILQSIASGMCGNNYKYKVLHLSLWDIVASLPKRKLILYKYFLIGRGIEITRSNFQIYYYDLYHGFFHFLYINSNLGGIAYSMAVADNIQSVFIGICIHFYNLGPNSPALQYRAVVLIIPLYIIAFPLCILKSIKYLEKVI